MDFKQYKYQIEGENGAFIVGVIFLVIAGVCCFVEGNIAVHAAQFFGMIGVACLIINYVRKCFLCLMYLCEYNSSSNPNHPAIMQQKIEEQRKTKMLCPYCKTELKKENGEYVCVVCLSHFNENLEKK